MMGVRGGTPCDAMNPPAVVMRMVDPGDMNGEPVKRLARVMPWIREQVTGWVTNFCGQSSVFGTWLSMRTWVSENYLWPTPGLMPAAQRCLRSAGAVQLPHHETHTIALWGQREVHCCAQWSL